MFPGGSALAEAWTRLRLWRCQQVGKQVTLRGRVMIHGGGRIHIGDRVRIDGRGVPVELHAFSSGQIEIGPDTAIEPGTSIEAMSKVAIGAGCRLGPFSKVLDNHFHPVSGDRHQRPPSEAVLLEDGVEVGARAIVLPGAHLERGVKVGAGSAIGRRVRAGSMVAGLPARAVNPGP